MSAIDTSNLKVTKLLIEIDGKPAEVVNKDKPVTTIKKNESVTTIKKDESVTRVNKDQSTNTVKKDEPAVPERDSNLFWKILGVLGLLALLALIALLLLRKPAAAVSTQTPGSAPASAPIVNPVDLPNQEVWKAVLTSANSNGNFIADLGGHGNGAIIPETAVDLQGKTWEIGRVLLTYCEDASTCFYSYGKPGDKLSRAFNVNAYTPEFVGDLFNELQYVNTGWNNNVNVTWTFVQ